MPRQSRDTLGNIKLPDTLSTEEMLELILGEEKNEHD